MVSKLELESRAPSNTEHFYYVEDLATGEFTRVPQVRGNEHHSMRLRYKHQQKNENLKSKI